MKSRASQLKPKPGDFALVHVKGGIGTYLSMVELMLGDNHTRYDHALIYIGGHDCVEAMPYGVVQAPLKAPYHALYGHALWSTGRWNLTDIERSDIVAAAKSYIGTPYNYFAWITLPTFSWNLPGKNLLPKIMGTHVLMCSQLVAQCYEDAGVPLFSRWPGYITPADEAAVIG